MRPILLAASVISATSAAVLGGMWILDSGPADAPYENSRPPSRPGSDELQTSRDPAHDGDTESCEYQSKSMTKKQIGEIALRLRRAIAAHDSAEVTRVGVVLAGALCSQSQEVRESSVLELASARPLPPAVETAALRCAMQLDVVGSSLDLDRFFGNVVRLVSEGPEMASADVVELLREIVIGSSNSAFAATAAQKLVAVGETRSVAELARFGPSVGCRFAAFSGLETEDKPSEDLVRAAIEGLSSDVPDIRSVSARLIGRHSPDGVGGRDRVIAIAVGDPSPPTRRFAVYAMIRIWEVNPAARFEIERTLAALLSDPDRGVRREAVQAAGSITPTSAELISGLRSMAVGDDKVLESMLREVIDRLPR